MTAKRQPDAELIAKHETTDLVAELLGGSRPRRQRIARRLLEQVGGIERARQLLDDDLSSCGASRTDVWRLLCALEVGRRALVPPGRPTHIREPRDAWRCVAPELLGARRERFVALLLDARNRPIRSVRILEGGVDSCPVDPREVFRPAVLARASGLIVAHNHPSGDPVPSPEDIALTDRLGRAGDALGIPLLDHLIVADDVSRPFISLAERGVICTRRDEKPVAAAEPSTLVPTRPSR